MKNGLEVFDFKEEDELPELVAGKYLDKFKNPSSDDHNDASLKYQYLECVAQGTNVQKKEVGNVPCVDVDAIDCDQSYEDAVTSKEGGASTAIPEGTAKEDFASTEENTGLDVSIQLNCASAEQNPSVSQDNDELRSCLSQLKSGNSCLQNGCVDMTPGAGDSMDESFPSSPTSGTAEVCVNGRSSDHCSDEFEMDDTVVLHPDYVEYLDNHYIAPIICFSCSGIKIMDATALVPFSFERGIDDIMRIRCQFFERMGLANIRLQVLSRDTAQVDNEHGASGVEEIRFAVFDPCWSDKLEEITSLNVKYSVLWNVVLDEDMELETGRLCKRKCYLPNFDEPFEDVIYPKGDVDAVSISKRDVDLLQPETFINDTIIDFYIKYLKNQIAPMDRHKFHFFNSFFFRKLADLDKDPSSISDGRAAFLRVRKWTRKVDIFGKDYVFIPVNFNLHWSLIIICHPGEVASFKDESLDQSLKVPCILHMDSIKGSHAGLKNLVQRYLWEEWKERHNETLEDISSKFLNLRFVPLELPQQENSFDCGLFLLHYLECFLAEVPEKFNPFKITKPSNFLNVNWFPASEVSLKRALIQRLIFEVLENHLRETNSAVCSDEHESSKFPYSDKNETGVEYVPEKCSTTVACHGNLSSSQAGQGIELTLLASASLKNVQCVNESGLVLRELFEPGASAASLLGQYQSFDQSSSYYNLSDPISPKEERVEAGGQYDLYMPSRESGFPGTCNTQVESMSYTSVGFGTSWNPGISMQAEHSVDTSPDTSSCSSDDSDVGIIEHVPVKDLGPSQEEGTDRKRSPSVEKIECLKEGPASTSCEMPVTSTTEGLRSPDKLEDGCSTGELLSDVGNPNIVLHMLENSLDRDSAENGEVPCDDMHMIGSDCLPELHEQQAAKRLRLTPPAGGLDGSLSEDLHL